MADYKFDSRKLFFDLIKLQQPEMVAIGCYAAFSGLLYLLTPLAVEEIVNVIAFGVVSQPLISLTILLMVGYLIAGSMRVAQEYAAELVQQRLFVHFSFIFSKQLNRLNKLEFNSRSLNYFFEIPNLQKGYSKLILDGLNAGLQITVGCIVLSFYHFSFFILVLFFTIFGAIFIRWTGIGGLKTSIEESERKYDAADWLKDLREEKENVNENATDSLNVKYINSRKRHFIVKVRQSVVILSIVALANAVLLGVGGWLVVNGQITVGRLIAAEIILALVLSALDKMAGLISEFYDLMTALVKLNHINNLCKEDKKDEITLVTRSY